MRVAVAVRWFMVAVVILLGFWTMANSTHDAIRYGILAISPDDMHTVPPGSRLAWIVFLVSLLAALSFAGIAWSISASLTRRRVLRALEGYDFRTEVLEGTPDGILIAECLRRATRHAKAAADVLGQAAFAKASAEGKTTAILWICEHPGCGFQIDWSPDFPFPTRGDILKAGRGHILEAHP